MLDTILNKTIDETDKTPIEIALGIDENGYTTARALYDFLDMPKQNLLDGLKRILKKTNILKKMLTGGGSSQ